MFILVVLVVDFFGIPINNHKNIFMDKYRSQENARMVKTEQHEVL